MCMDHMQVDGPQAVARVFPMWSMRPAERRLKLIGFQVLAMPVICALYLLDLEAATRPFPAGPPTLVPPGTGAGVLDAFLAELEAEHGSRAVALDIARAAAVDALQCCNAWYVSSDAGELQAQRAWREEDVEGYMRLCWDARQRLREGAFALDVSWLVEEGFAEWDDVPQAVQAWQWPPVPIGSG